jgi:hypothetical protein
MGNGSLDSTDVSPIDVALGILRASMPANVWDNAERIDHIWNIDMFIKTIRLIDKTSRSSTHCLRSSSSPPPPLFEQTTGTYRERTMPLKRAYPSLPISRISLQ